MLIYIMLFYVKSCLFRKSEDIFQDFFGGGRPGRQQRGYRGDDLRYRMVITFEEAVFGSEPHLAVGILQNAENVALRQPVVKRQVLEAHRMA